MKSKESYYLPWKGFLFTVFFAAYLIVIGFTMLVPILTTQHPTGVYQPVFGSSVKEQVMNTTLDLWDRCELPKYDIWDNDILQYIDLDENPVPYCDKYLYPWTYLDNGSWGFVEDNQNVTCRARCHWRKTERSNIIGKWMMKPGPVNCEILETVCSANDNVFYGYIHTQILPTPQKTPKVNISDLEQYDVTVILLDSLSYSQARRSLPRTISYLTDHMNAVLFPYINKVGDNSRPNGAALWFGKLIEKLDRSLFDEKDVAADWNHHYMCRVFKDNETSLFRDFQDYGYKTLLAEDWAEGTLNWPNCRGFNQPPIDHYMRPFQNAMERENHGMKVTKQHMNGATFCREHHQTLLDYLGDFLVKYPDQRKFSWIWPSVLGHDSENGFPHSDNDFYKFLANHKMELENSFVFFMGDHGLRFGGIRTTFVGALDVNNPFLAVSVPKKLRTSTRLLETMKENSQKLQTHFDTRATILDILKYQPAKKFTATSPHKIDGEKGNSFIRKQPDDLRNCRSMPIPMQYCICQFKKTNVPVETEIAFSIGSTVTDMVNQQLEEGNFTESCIQMNLSHIVSLAQYDEKFKGSTLYTVVVQMEKPSDAQFKANVKVLEDGTVKVLGMVERSDRYGNTANCIKSEHHRPYCHCSIMANK